MSVGQVKMFFARLGGRDIPLAYNWYDKFGFNSTYDSENKQYINYSGDPIYKHSLMDVLNNFENPISFTTSDKLGTLKSVSDISIVETKGNEEVKNIIITSVFWQKALKLFEYIYENQAEWKNVAESIQPSGEADYSCRGDEILRKNDSGIFDDVLSIYIPGTLVPKTVTSDILNNRILSYTIKLTNSKLTEEERNQDNGTISSNISLTVYLNPDTYISQGAEKNYAVYSYEDLSTPKDDKIDDSVLNIYDENGGAAKTEFQANIVDKITQILKTGKYKRVIRFCPTGGTTGSTFYIDKGKYGTKDGYSVLFTDETETEVINDDNMRDYGYNKPFYIFTSLDETEPISDSVLIGYIKNYIDSVMFPNAGTDTAQMVERNLRFPNLFVETIVSMYPIISNFEPGSNNNLRSPLDGKMLKAYLSKAGITDDQYEILYLGKAVYSGGSSQFTEIPIIASEHDTSSTSDHPITSRFPKFRPITSAVAEDNSDMDADTIILHDLCVLALSVLVGITEIEDISNKITINGVEYDFVSSLTDFKEIEGGYSQTEGGYINHSVQFNFKNIKYKIIDVSNN